MTLQYDISAVDLSKIREALRDPELVKEPLGNFLRRSAFIVEAAAKQRAPVDTGRLRSSIGTVIDLPGARAMVGTPVQYAAFVEFGTRPHWPPQSALQPWARRHGFPAGSVGAFLVARTIARRGTKAQPFMRPAFEASRARVIALLGEMALAIEKLFVRKTK